MESFLSHLTLFSLLLFASTIDARKDPSEYWKGVMQDQQMPEALQDLVVHAHPASNNINEGQLVKNCENKEDQKPYAEDFEPKPNSLAYTNEDKSYAEDFEPKPNSLAYTNEDKSFAKDFKPKPNVLGYTDEDKSFAKDFKPNNFAYPYDVGPKDDMSFP